MATIPLTDAEIQSVGQSQITESTANDFSLNASDLSIQKR
ncbi:MAG: hypothetical protein ACI9GO_000950 [Bacteroidia bacterium]|jgi:hypothetical protein